MLRLRPAAVTSLRFHFTVSRRVPGVVLHVTGSYAEARINPDGSDQTNAVVGETKIAINCREPYVQEGGVRQELVPGKSIVPTKYGSPETSELKYTITPGEDTYDIRL